MIKLILILTSLFLFEITHAWNIPPSESQKQYLSDKNQLKNGGFENGSANWTASGGSFAVTSTAAQVFLGVRAGSWDASASSQTLTSSTWTSKTDASGNGEASCRIKTAATDYVMQVYDGTNVIESLTISASDSSEFKLHALNFAIGATSTGYRIRIVSASDASVLYIDDCYLGYATNLKDVAQASFVGSAYIAGTTNCQWSRTNTALGAFGTDADCPGPTVELNPGPGTIQTTDADLPQFTVNDLPAGTYQVIITGLGGNSAGGGANFAINDGTTTSGIGNGNTTSGAGAQWTSIGYFTYTSSGNRTFQVYGAASANTVNLFNAVSTYRVTFSIHRFPLESQLAYTQDQANFGWIPDTALITNSAGFGTVTNEEVYKKRLGDTLIVRFSWNNGTVAASTASIDISGLTMDTTKMSAQTNRQRVGGCTVLFDSGTGTTNTGSGDRADLFYDGSDTNTLFFSYQTASGQFTKVNGSTLFNTGRSLTCEFAVPISGWKDTNVPSLLGSVITQEAVNPSRVLSVLISYSGGVPSASTTDRIGNWISSVSDDGTGLYTLNFVAGTFSATPFCYGTTVAAAGSYQNPFIRSRSSSAVQFYQGDSTGVASDQNAVITCMGSK